MSDRAVDGGSCQEAGRRGRFNPSTAPAFSPPSKGALGMGAAQTSHNPTDGPDNRYRLSGSWEAKALMVGNGNPNLMVTVSWRTDHQSGREKGGGMENKGRVSWRPKKGSGLFW